mmetsp:Transcript_6691/g.22860  ORF Transcript_6691/g.22860 Transcript_6691/m.22860 type:complete len:301 (+) Transcript_6691:46-948(+)
MSEFRPKAKGSAGGGRDVTEVFKTAPKPDGMLQQRFGSSGQYTQEELEQREGGLQVRKKAALEQGMRVRVIGRYGVGELAELVEEGSWRVVFDDGVEALVATDKITPHVDGEEEEPEDNRTLYEKLKEQKDRKQEEWEFNNTFKNQMGHWRLDEEDAAFEAERADREQEALDRKRAEADSDHAAYRAAMLARVAKAPEDPVQAALGPLAPPKAPAPAGAAAEPSPAAKRKAPFAVAPKAIVVKRRGDGLDSGEAVASGGRQGSGGALSTDGAPAAAPAAQPPSSLSALANAYGESDDESE